MSMRVWVESRRRYGLATQSPVEPDQWNVQLQPEGGGDFEYSESLLTCRMTDRQTAERVPIVVEA